MRRSTRIGTGERHRPWRVQVTLRSFSDPQGYAYDVRRGLETMNMFIERNLEDWHSELHRLYALHGSRNAQFIALVEFLERVHEIQLDLEGRLLWIETVWEPWEYA